MRLSYRWDEINDAFDNVWLVVDEGITSTGTFEVQAQSSAPSDGSCSFLPGVLRLRGDRSKEEAPGRARLPGERTSLLPQVAPMSSIHARRSSRWLGFVLATHLPLWPYENRPLKLVAINMGSNLVSLVLMGVLFGLWH